MYLWVHTVCAATANTLRSWRCERFMSDGAANERSSARINDQHTTCPNPSHRTYRCETVKVGGKLVSKERLRRVYARFDSPCEATCARTVVLLLLLAERPNKAVKTQSERRARSDDSEGHRRPRETFIQQAKEVYQVANGIPYMMIVCGCG